MSAPLATSQRSVGDVTIVELSGHLVYDSDRAFREEIKSLVRSGQTQILVDLSRVTYIDSCGIGSLVAMFLHVLRRGGSMKVICPSHRARRVLKITHLLTVFEVFPTEAQGIESFRAWNRKATGPTQV